MADLFPAAYDPTQLENNAEGANTNAQNALSVLQNSTHGNPAIRTAISQLASSNNADLAGLTSDLGQLETLLNQVKGYIDSEVASILNTVTHGTYGNAAIRSALSSLAADSGVDLSGLEAAQATMTSLLNQIESYTDTEVAQILSLVQQVVGYTDTVESSLASLISTTNSISGKVDTEVADIRSAVLSTSFGLSRIKTAVDNLALNTGGEVDLSPLQNAINSANSVLTNGTYGNSAIRTRLNEVYGKVDTEVATIQNIVNHGTHGNAAIRTRLNEVYAKVDTEIASIISTLNSVNSKVDTEVASILSKVDQLLAGEGAWGDLIYSGNSAAEYTLPSTGLYLIFTTFAGALYECTTASTSAPAFIDYTPEDYGQFEGGTQVYQYDQRHSQLLIRFGGRRVITNNVSSSPVINQSSNIRAVRKLR